MTDDEIMQVVNSKPENTSSCIFCEIIAGRIATFKIYETDSIIVILDINPASRGHIIAMPKQHFHFLSQMPNELILELFAFVKFVSPILIKALNAKGTMINIPQGLGQNVPHVAINIVPRYDGDNPNFNLKGQESNKEELEKIRVLLRNEIANIINSSLNSQKETQQDTIEQETERENIEEKNMRIP